MSSFPKRGPHSPFRYGHNTDLFPGDATRKAYPLLEPLFATPDLRSEFREYDDLGSSYLRIYHGLGTGSLVCGTLSLLLVAVVLAQLASVPTPPEKISLQLIEALDWLALVALLCAGIIGLSRFAEHHQQARFVTEALRRWSFQRFLDGALVDLAHADQSAYEAEACRRYELLIYTHRALAGVVGDFLQNEEPLLHHNVSLVTNPELRAQLFEAYETLRFGTQSWYFQMRREQFGRMDAISDGIARWTLITAYIIPLIEIYYIEVHHHPNVGLLFLALLAAILGMAVRVWRSARGISEERERYETKWMRVKSLHSAFRAASDDEVKLDLMKEMEIIAIEEHREFLRIARKSSYAL